MRTRLIVLLAFSLVALEAVVSVPKLSWELSVNRAPILGDGLAVAAAVAAVIIVWYFRMQIASHIKVFTTFCAQVPAGRWLLFCMLTGIGFRILWIFLFPAPRQSDSATYFELAQSLSQHHSYIVPHCGYAYWPPGYPFFLLSLFSVFGIHDWIPIAANLLLFIATILVAYRLASEIGDAEIARFSTLLLVVWPTFVTSSGLASKELLVLFLLPAAVLSFMNSTNNEGAVAKIAWLAASGATLGFASLVQPSLLLFPGVLVVYDRLRQEKWRVSVGRLAAIVAMMLLVIFPWTLRNHRVLGQWILISTNGGDVFYRANNERASGGYTSSDPHLSNLNEIELSKISYQLGEQWIRTHPQSFLSLIFKKQVLFLGDDAYGVYETLKRGLGIGGVRYFLLKGFSNLFWWLVWLGILVQMMVIRERSFLGRPDILLLMLSFIYLFCIHSIFESNGRYHVPLLVFVAILASPLVIRNVQATNTR